jgi:hypothetical protein
LSIWKIIILDTSNIIFCYNRNRNDIDYSIIKSICFIKIKYQWTFMIWFHGIQPILLIIGYHWERRIPIIKRFPTIRQREMKHGQKNKKKLGQKKSDLDK